MTLVILSSLAQPAAIERVVQRLRALNLTLQVSQGSERTIILVLGNDDAAVAPALTGLEGVERVQTLTHPFHLSAREVRPEGTLVPIGGLLAGGPRLLLIAGPADPFGAGISGELAERLQEAGADIVRCGVYRPPSLHYGAPQVDMDALARLGDLRRSLNLPVAVAPLAPEDVPLLARSADLLIMGPQEMGNRGLLQACGYVERPVVLSRAPSALADEWLQSADTLLGRGNRQVLLAAGGIRTFEPALRLTPDLSAIALVKRRSHLPVFADLCGLEAGEDLLAALAAAAVAAGADGLLLDVRAEAAGDSGALALAALPALTARLRRLAEGLRQDTPPRPRPISPADATGGAPA